MLPTRRLMRKASAKGEWDIAIGSRVFAAPDKADLISDVWLVDLIYVAAPQSI